MLIIKLFGLYAFQQLLLLNITLVTGSYSSFLPDPYYIHHSTEKEKDISCFLVRQVPGDGGCLFHSLAVSLSFVKHQKHFDFDKNMREFSNKLRGISVKTLLEDRELVTEHGEKMGTKYLLEHVANHYRMTPQEYCEQMQDPKTWGGGPEIVALSNYLHCPIHVYELCSVGFLRKSFRIKLSAEFGTPDFDNRQPLRILCADGRFPNVSPGKQKRVGDHFLALFPYHSTIKADITLLKCPSLDLEIMNLSESDISSEPLGIKELSDSDIIAGNIPQPPLKHLSGLWKSFRLWK